jgi:hypothetical protein
MRALVLILVAFGCVFSIGCGSVGEPLYPAVNIPTRISDLTAVERGARIDIAFTIPALTTEGLTVKAIGRVELRVGPNPNSGAAFQSDQWAAAAKLVDVAPAPSGPGPVRVPVAAQQFIGQDVIVGVRLANSKGRLSDWSNFATLRIEEPLATPANFKVADVPQGVSLTWTEPAVSQFRVYRKTAQDKQPSLLATTQEPNYLDSTTEYGKTYEYHIEGVHEKTVSDLAGPLSITPKDVFPPAVPTGLTASAGIGSIELAWERSTEPDFKEYRVLRSEGGAAFVQIAAGLEAPSYSDRSVESGKRYRYRVAAVDQAGNSSEPSNPVEATAP